jgi:hypothetical protein
MKAVSLTLVVSLTLGPAWPAVSAESGPQSQASAARPAPQGARRLDLSRYLFRSGPLGPTPEGLRFESSIDVDALARHDPNDALARFMEGPTHSIYRGAPNSKSPFGTTLIDVLPAIAWLAGKVKDKIKDRREAE